MVTDTLAFPCLFCGAWFTYTAETPRAAVQQMIEDHARSHA